MQGEQEMLYTRDTSEALALNKYMKYVNDEKQCYSPLLRCEMPKYFMISRLVIWW